MINLLNYMGKYCSCHSKYVQIRFYYRKFAHFIFVILPRCTFCFRRSVQFSVKSTGLTVKKYEKLSRKGENLKIKIKKYQQIQKN